MIDAAKVKHRGVQIVDMHFLIIVNVAVAEFVGAAPVMWAVTAERNGCVEICGLKSPAAHRVALKCGSW